MRNGKMIRVANWKKIGKYETDNCGTTLYQQNRRSDYVVERLRWQKQSKLVVLKSFGFASSG